MGKKRKRNEIDDAQFGTNYSSSKFKDERKLLERYGVEGQSHGRKGRTYRGSDDVRKDLQKAMANDYDTRRSLEAASMAGNKKASKLIKKGFKSFQDMEDTQSFFKKQHKKAGGGGDFSSTNDYMNLTQSLVKKDRAKQTASYDEKYATKEELSELEKVKTVDEQVEEAKPYEPSEKVKQAKERVAGYKEGVTTGGDGDEQRAQAADSYNKYRLNLSTMK